MGIDPRIHGAAGGNVPNFVVGATGGRLTPQVGQASSKVDANTKAIQDNTNAVNSNTTEEKNNGGEQTITNPDKEREGMGLIQLFAFQSLLSGANGMLEELGTSTTGAIKSMIGVAQAASNVTASFIQQKTIANEVMSAFNVKQEDGIGLGRGLGNLGGMLGGGGRGRGARGGRGGMGGMMRGLGKIGSIFSKVTSTIGKFGGAIAKGGKFLLRFAPLVGQLFTGFTLVNEGIKAFGGTLKKLPLVGSVFKDWEKGDGIFDLLKDSATRAAEKIEKLADVSDKASAAVEANNAVQETQEKITKLEVLGDKRTLKQTKELAELQLTLLKQNKERQKSVSDLINSEHLDTSSKKELTTASMHAAADLEKFGKKLMEVQAEALRGQVIQAASAELFKGFKKVSNDGLTEEEAMKQTGLMMKSTVPTLASSINLNQDAASVVKDVERLAFNINRRAPGRYNDSTKGE